MVDISFDLYDYIDSGILDVLVAFGVIAWIVLLVRLKSREMVLASLVVFVALCYFFGSFE